MRMIPIAVTLAALAGGCLRATAFHCSEDLDCGAGGACEPAGYCSRANPACPGTGRSFTDAAGGGLANACVPGASPGADAGVDAPPVDGPPSAGCPAGYAPIAGSAHAYKVLANTTWDTARAECKATSSAAYLAVPDDAGELARLAAAAGAPFWIGVDDQLTEGAYATQKGGAAAFLPWAAGEPDNGPPEQDCVAGVSPTQIATDRCSTRHDAVCECEP